MYLGGDLVARDAETFKTIGITHVLNCVGDYSENYHEKDGVIYKRYYLKDHVGEDIACCFYDAIEFMTDARNKGGKVYVHCVQGVSRSATMIIAYMIFTDQISFQEGEKLVKARRGCVNPNLRFINQLISFHRRLYDKDFASVGVNPRVYQFTSHQPTDPQRIVGKLLMTNLYGKQQNPTVLDPRGMFVVHAENSIWLWVGAEIPAGNHKAYMAAVEQHVSLLQKYERAP
jgi:protein-tyrosine phosphatase